MGLDTLWYTRCPAPTAASIAIWQGWLEQEFARDQIKVRSLAASADKQVQLSHYRHSQPNSFRFGGYVPPLISRARGADLKVIGLSWHDRVHGFFALPDSGITNSADLKGKRLAVPRRVNDDVDWWRASVLGGIKALFKLGLLSENDVELVDVVIEREYIADARAGQAAGQSLWGAVSQFAVQREEVAALYRGTVDAIYSDGALTAILRATTGAQLVVPLAGNEDAHSGFGTPCVLTVSSGLLDERPDLVTRWIQRLLEARSWAVAHEDLTHRMFSRETGLPEDLLHSAYSPRLAAQADVSLSPNRVALLRSKYQHLLDMGLLETAFDFDTFIDPAPLTAAIDALKPSLAGVLLR
ncbi:2'-hydroxybiphenyl-2-sulfinate desulfinase [Rhodoferax lithotrophicus]|uniref:2'-hydroxybiphenyl-2-sulfinate desulfinase n=1 Tax=Rhodoferax lithotrophicus TaxID=2798804 RepID=A0ABN6D9J0_9BURK|nr:ABC transporter substrate-binding protein [Rhodoferax sp. MIZ03]BCO28413.1 2'-hydroxybiphenyl-2-sulfinate desulfinase [Rhodoferax sp. MIZ03]